MDTCRLENKVKFLNPEQHDFFADTDKLKTATQFYWQFFAGKSVVTQRAAAKSIPEPAASTTRTSEQLRLDENGESDHQCTR
jgi:hypothetical protein